MAHWPRFLPIVLSLVLLACAVPIDDPTLSPASVSTTVPTRVPTRPSAATLANQDVLLRHCIESEMRRGNISHAEASDALGKLAVIRDPGDPYRLGLVVRCSQLGYLNNISKGRSTQGSASVVPTSMPVPKATRTPTRVPTATVVIPTPTPTPTPNPLPAELTSGVDALVHCAGETVEYWLGHGPPTLTADLAACLNAYLERLEG